MNRIQVKSSNLDSIGYSEDTKTLEVKFIKSGVYQYSDVPKEVYDNFIASESKGKFFFKNIRGVYKFVKV